MTAALYRAAAERLAKTGWKRGNIGPKAGPNCLLGALYWSLSPDQRQPGVYTAPMTGADVLVRLLAAQYPEAAPYADHEDDPLNQIVWYNDAVVESEADAIRMLEKTAVLLDEEAATW